MKTLKGTVTNILNKRVTEEEAQQFALTRFGELATYIRQEFMVEYGITKKETTFKMYGRNKVRIEK